MIKFKRYNASQKAKENETSYVFNDMLRQTTIKYIVEKYSKSKKEHTIKALLNMIENQLNEMIIEVKE